jgi:CubicO group peptidase (beta-lactamase class C family)
VDWDRLGEAVRRAADSAGFSGHVLVRDGGAERLRVSCGLADRTHAVPVTRRTRFGIASFCKMFTAHTVASIVAEGRVAFSDSVRQLLPADVDLPWLRDAVTLGQVLSHTAGLPDYLREDEVPEGEADIFTPVLHGRPVYSLRTVRDFLPLLQDLGPVPAPPQPLAYSSTGYLLAGLVIEAVTRQTFTEAVTERVLIPAGLADTGYPSVDGLEPDLATGYVDIGGVLRSNVFLLPPVGGPDGGAFSTADDMAAFLEAVDRDAVVPGSREVMLAPHADAGEGVHYGYGAWTIGRPGEARFRFGHGGFDPGFECWGFRWPAAEVTAVLTSNVNEAIDPVRSLVLEAVDRHAAGPR